jgi:hypothetical protein
MTPSPFKPSDVCHMGQKLPGRDETVFRIDPPGVEKDSSELWQMTNHPLKNNTGVNYPYSKP